AMKDPCRFHGCQRSWWLARCPFISHFLLRKDSDSMTGGAILRSGPFRRHQRTCCLGAQVGRLGCMGDSNSTRQLLTVSCRILTGLLRVMAKLVNRSQTLLPVIYTNKTGASA